MKNLILIILITCSPSLFAQEHEGEKEYLLNAPEDWRKELIPFPLGFAPSLDYQGVEEIRFSKGWSDQSSEQFWSYMFMWYLDKDPALTEEKLEKDFEIYFDGIMGAVGKSQNIPSDSISKTIAIFLANEENKNVFKGKVITFDSFFLKDEVKLNFKVRSFYCDERQKYVAYFNISPLPFDHKIWMGMDNISLGGSCK